MLQLMCLELMALLVAFKKLYMRSNVSGRWLWLLMFWCETEESERKFDLIFFLFQFIRVCVTFTFDDSLIVACDIIHAWCRLLTQFLFSITNWSYVAEMFCEFIFEWTAKTNENLIKNLLEASMLLQLTEFDFPYHLQKFPPQNISPSFQITKLSNKVRLKSL